MIAHLKRFEVITKSHNGFLSSITSANNVSECLNVWPLMLGRKSNIVIKYFDLEKAFDSLIHENLLYMLTKVRFGGNCLM